MSLSYDDLAAYVGTHAGIRAVTELEPLAGPGSKVFPPTYGVDDSAETKYAIEKRTVVDGEGPKRSEAVVLDSVAGQAHQLSTALREAWEAEELELPLVGVDFTSVDGLTEFGVITDLDAPHRVYDAINRDSLDGDVTFRSGQIGKAVTDATVANATALYINAPAALLFGAWDSTGPKGGRGSKFERAITSEIVALDISVGAKTSSRIDPLGIERISGIFMGPDKEWSFEKPKSGAKEVRPSEINHGNVTPSIDSRSGGITAARIEATTVISLIQLRRLKFPRAADGTIFDRERAVEVGAAARAALAALGLAATALAFETGFDLRSRCVLAPTANLEFEAVGRSGATQRFTLTGKEGLELVREASAAAADAGLPWRSGLHRLTPTPRLAELVRRSREASVNSSPEA